MYDINDYEDWAWCPVEYELWVSYSDGTARVSEHYDRMDVDMHLLGERMKHGVEDYIVRRKDD